MALEKDSQSKSARTGDGRLVKIEVSFVGTGAITHPDARAAHVLTMHELKATKVGAYQLMRSYASDLIRFFCTEVGLLSPEGSDIKGRGYDLKADPEREYIHELLTEIDKLREQNRHLERIILRRSATH